MTPTGDDARQRDDDAHPPSSPDAADAATSGRCTAAADPVSSSTDSSNGGEDGEAKQQQQRPPTERCPICLDDMGRPDVCHPLQCPTKCGYNFCSGCMANLVGASNDDYELASDGNRHVKVRLQCPNCRGDVSESIHDTLLLRKAATVEDLLSIPDSELSAAELRLKHEFSPGMRADLKLALSRSKDYYDEHPNVRRAILDAFDAKTGEEVGIEIDEREETLPTLLIDTTLFRGLHYAMTDEEQAYVTELMTSGNADMLAQASQILASVAEMSRQGVTPSMRSKKGASSNDAGRKQTIKRVGPESEEIEIADRRTTASRGRGGSSAASVGGAMALRRHAGDDFAAKAKRDAEIKAHRRLHPLPVRMPLSVVLSTDFDPYHASRRGRQSSPLLFGDDEWDGSIADAFSRLNVGRNDEIWRQSRSQEEEDGVRNVLCAGGGSEHETHISAPRNRVVVTVVRGQAGRQGVMKGDVVTHVNGESFEGDAEALRQLLASLCAELGEGGSISLVVNAEACTAEALRLRARSC